MPKKRTLPQFITQSNEAHNNTFDYSSVIYVDDNTKVDVICKVHGSFKVTPTNHLHLKSGCPDCWTEKRKTLHKKSLNDFINQSNAIHNNFYDYSKVMYVNNNTKIEIVCPKHGSFLQQPNVHTDQKCGCPVCNKSKGEKAVFDWLEKHDIKFQQQKKFDDCRYKNQLSFDFFLPDRNLLIEYNGIQHYRNVPLLKYSNDQFENIQIRDKIKKKYVKEKGLKLLTIPYTCKDIESLLNSKLLANAKVLK